MANDGMCFQRLLRSSAWHRINDRYIWAIITKCSLPPYFKERGDNNKQRRHQPYSWWCTPSPALMIYSNMCYSTADQSQWHLIPWGNEILDMHACMHVQVGVPVHAQRLEEGTRCHPLPPPTLFPRGRVSPWTWSSSSLASPASRKPEWLPPLPITCTHRTAAQVVIQVINTREPLSHHVSIPMLFFFNMEDHMLLLILNFKN